MYPQYAQQYAPPPLTQAQRDAAIVQEIRRIRQELTTAFNPYSLQKLLDNTLMVMEYMLAGAVIHANPNQVPGRPVDPLDSGKTKVEFFGGPQAPVPQALPGYGPAAPAFPLAAPAATPAALSPGAFSPPAYAPASGFAPPPFGSQAQPVAPAAPSAPVTNGDVQFVQTGPAPQGVEFYGGPPGGPHGTPQSYEHNGQRVEFFPNPPGTPVTGAPPTPPVATQNNPPTAQFMQGAPAMTVEAGNPVPAAHAPPQAAGLPVAPPFASVMPPPTHAQPHTPSTPRTPQTREELISMLPIPAAPNGA